MAKHESIHDDTIYLNSLRRGLQALEYLNRNDFVSATELANYLDLPRTTARRVLDTLVLDGYLCKIPQDCRYHITPAVAALSRGLNDESLIVDVATPLMAEKTKELGWAFHIAVQRDENMLLRAETGRFSPHVIRRFKVGCKGPIIYSAAGHVMLSFMPSDKRHDLVTMLKTSRNPLNHAVREDSFVANLVATTRSSGYARTYFKPGTESFVAVPLFIENEVKACLTMQHFTSAISERQIQQDYKPILDDMARAIANRVLRRKAGGTSKTRHSPAFTGDPGATGSP